MNDQLAYNVALLGLTFQFFATIAFCGVAICLCKFCFAWCDKQNAEADYWDVQSGRVDEHESSEYWRNQELMQFMRAFAWQVGLTPADVEAFGNAERFASSGRRPGSPDTVQPEQKPSLRPVTVPEEDDEDDVDGDDEDFV